MTGRRFAVTSIIAGLAYFTLALALMRLGDGQLSAAKFENGGQAALQSGLLMNRIGGAFFAPIHWASDAGAPDWLLLTMVPTTCLGAGILVTAIIAFVRRA